jgi:3D (Asp-Asp-Asp) domain-containing protein
MSFKKNVALLMGVCISLVITSCSTSSGLSLFRSSNNTYAGNGSVDTDFVQPLAPSPSAKPTGKSKNLGRDRHKMPFYHPDQRNRVVRTTAYTHSERDHVGYGPRNAVGTSLKYTSTVRSAAADWSVYPLGTKFRVKGQPYIYVVDDYGSALVGTGTIDIYQPNKNLMKKWGRRYVEITVVQWGNPDSSMEVLANRTGYRHCRAMYAALANKRNKGFFAKAD